MSTKKHAVTEFIDFQLLSQTRCLHKKPKTKLKPKDEQTEFKQFYSKTSQCPDRKQASPNSHNLAHTPQLKKRQGKPSAALWVTPLRPVPTFVLPSAPP